MARIRSTAALMACVAGVMSSDTARADDFLFTFVGASVRAEGLVTAVSNGTGSLRAVSGSLTVGTGGAAGNYDLFQNANGDSPIISPSGFFIFDNQVNPSAGQPINWYGLLFTGGGAEINVWGNLDHTTYTFYSHGPGGNIRDTGQFTLTAVPAPGGVALVGLAGVCVAVGRRRPALVG